MRRKSEYKSHAKCAITNLFFFFSEAVETRHALHGVKWPDHNLKTLNVEFSTEEEMNKVAIPPLAERDAVASSDAGREGKSGFGWSKADIQKSPEDRSKVKVTSPILCKF